MAQFTGELKVVNGRERKSKKPPYRPYTSYSLIVLQEDGSESGWLDAGFEKPAAEKGDYVTVVTEKNDRGYEVVKSITKAERPAKKHTEATTPAGAPEFADGADRQTQIVLQHSQEMAIAEVSLLLQHNALPLSAASNKGGTVKRFEEITAAIEKLTVQRFFDVVTARLLENVADAGEVDTAPDAPLPAAANDDKATGTDD